MIDKNKYNIYLEVKHELLLEDALNFIKDYLEANDWDLFDLDNDDYIAEKYDLEYLVQQFEEKESYSSFDNAWKNIIENYMEDFEED